MLLLDLQMVMNLDLEQRLHKHTKVTCKRSHGAKIAHNKQIYYIWKWANKRVTNTNNIEKERG